MKTRSHFIKKKFKKKKKLCCIKKIKHCAFLHCDIFMSIQHVFSTYSHFRSFDQFLVSFDKFREIYPDSSITFVVFLLVGFDIGYPCMMPSIV